MPISRVAVWDRSYTLQEFVTRFLGVAPGLKWPISPSASRTPGYAGQPPGYKKLACRVLSGQINPEDGVF
jgi:hypothetical protein